MELETVRMVTDHLKDPDEGVDACLALIEKDDPKDAKPEKVGFIGDETRDEVVAGWLAPPRLPALYVSIDGPMAVQGETPTFDYRDTMDGSGVAVAVRFLQKEPTKRKAVQERCYVIRAVVMSLTRLLNKGTSNIRNGIEMIAAERIDYGRWREAVGDCEVTAAVVVMFKTRDNAV